MQSNPSKILIVDDDLDMQSILLDILLTEGFEVIQAHNGVEALEKLATHILKLPDLIILDSQMPIMDGGNFLQAAADLYPEYLSRVPVIFSTASEKSHSLGNYPGLTRMQKPISLEALLITIRKGLVS